MKPLLPTEHSLREILRIYGGRLGVLLAILAVDIVLLAIAVLVALYPVASLTILAVLVAVVVAVWGIFYRFAGASRVPSRLLTIVASFVQTQWVVLKTEFRLARGKEQVYDWRKIEDELQRPPRHEEDR